MAENRIVTWYTPSENQPHDISQVIIMVDGTPFAGVYNPASGVVMRFPEDFAPVRLVDCEWWCYRPMFKTVSACAIETMDNVIAKIKVARLLPGDLLVLTTRDELLSTQAKIGIKHALQSVLPAWVKVVVLDGNFDLHVVRPDGE